jgi:hypothetical protein
MSISEARSEEFRRPKFKALGRKSISNTKRSIFEAKGPYLRNKINLNGRSSISKAEIQYRGQNVYI